MNWFIFFFFFFFFFIGNIEEVSEAVYQGLRQFPGIGPFNAYQMAVDIGYWRQDLFDENVFTVAGPGAKNGVSICFDSYGKWDRSQVVVKEEVVEEEVDLPTGGSSSSVKKKKKKKKIYHPPIPFEKCIAILVKEVNNGLLQELGGVSPEVLFSDRPLGKRCLNLMSMENCMCELSKYARDGRNGRVKFPGVNEGGKVSASPNKKVYVHSSALLR